MGKLFDGLPGCVEEAVLVYVVIVVVLPPTTV